MHSLLPRPIGRSRAEIGSPVPTVRLLGREAELDVLAGGVQRGLDDVVLLHVEGEAGLGKSRLLDELTRRLDGVRIGRASCSELEQHLPYVPLAAALRQAFDGVELDVRRAPALGQILPELAPDLPSRRFDEVEVLEALVSVVAEHAPIVLVLDDLQWADPSTLAALAYLRRRGARSRPGHRHRRAAAGRRARTPSGGLAPDTIIRLEPLTPAELAPLGIADLHEATGGHPGASPTWSATAGRQVHRRTLTEALLDQCRAEGPQAFRLLAAASVLDQPFDPEPLADLLGTDPTELTEELERLCERRILRIDGLRFRFRYDLVRQVLRETISPARQRLLQQRLDRPARRRSASGRRREPDDVDRSHARPHLRDVLRALARACLRHGPGAQLHPRRERRRLRPARVHARGAAPDADLQHPPVRARRAERAARTGPARRPGVDDQAHLPNEAGHVPPDRDLAPRARDRRPAAHPRTRPGPERAPPALRPATEPPHSSRTGAGCTLAEHVPTATDRRTP